MELLNTIIVLVPILALFIRTEQRLAKIETNIDWLKKNLNGDCP